MCKLKRKAWNKGLKLCHLSCSLCGMDERYYEKVAKIENYLCYGCQYSMFMG